MPLTVFFYKIEGLTSFNFVLVSKRTNNQNAGGSLIVIETDFHIRVYICASDSFAGIQVTRTDMKLVLRPQAQRQKQKITWKCVQLASSEFGEHIHHQWMEWHHSVRCHYHCQYWVLAGKKYSESFFFAAFR